MRVVAGRYRGRRISAPPGKDLRPTADRVREAVFNILVHREGPSLAGARVLDAFAGTGAMGIEALSRGAAHATFMDDDTDALSWCRRNLASLNQPEESWSVIRADCLAPPPAPATCGVVFLDPPYGAGLAAPALDALRASGWIADDAVISVEVAARETFRAPDGFVSLRERRYGATRVIFLEAESAAPE